MSEFFDQQAERYDRVYDQPGRAGRVVRNRMAATVRLLGDGPGEALDAGMASGRVLEELERREWTVTGLDASPAMVELARRRLPGRNLSVGRLEALPFPDGSFDAVVATGVLEYVDDIPAALAEIRRVLRPGGRAAVSFPNYRSPHNLWRRHLLYPAVRAVKRVVPFGRPAPQPWRHPFAPSQFEVHLADAGFRIARSERVGAATRPGCLRSRQLVYALTKS